MNILDEERQKCKFNLEDLSHLVYGGKENYEHFQQISQALEQDQVFQNDPLFYSLSREEQFIQMSKKASRLPKLLPNNGIFETRNMVPVILFNNHQVVGSVHLGMVIPYIDLNSTEEQRKRWLPDAMSYQRIGAYAQTELGRGSDIQNLETTAQYDPNTETFVLNSPTNSSWKFWPGDLGISANFALVFAQMIVNQKKYGVQAFYTQIRDYETHQLLPGVDAGDIGPKIGYESKDNGYLRLTNYSVPRENLLAQYISITKQGEVKQGNANPKVGHATMMLTRAYICSVSPRFFGQALLISIRYSLSRRQFQDSKGQERPVMDYQSQFQKLIGGLADFYSFLASGFKISEYCDRNLKQVREKNDFSLMAETHGILCGGKSYISEIAFKGIETCRLACGGHGFSLFSGLPQIQTEYYAHNTHEGENTVLYLQLSKYLIKNFQSIISRKIPLHELKLADSVAYLKYSDDMLNEKCMVENAKQFENSEVIRRLLIQNSTFLIRKVFNKIAQKLASGMKPKEVMDTKLGIDLIQIARAHMSFLVFKWNNEWVSNVNEQELRVVLSQLSLLSGINSILNRANGLLEGDFLKPEHFDMLIQTRNRLYEAIRPNALGLVEALGHSDNALRTAIGTQDGKWVENLYNWNREFNPINKEPVFHQYVKEIKGMVNAKPIHAKL